MKKLSSLLLAVFITVTTLFTLSPLKANLLNESLESSTVLGDLLHAEAGTNFTGVLYTRDGKVFYNQFGLDGTWGVEVELGTGIEGRIAVSASDKPHVVFTTSGKIGYRMFDGTVWTETVLIESRNLGGTGACSKPDIAVDGNQFAHITYTDSHGSSGDDYTHPDIMYATNSTGSFNVSLIYRGYRDYSSSGSWGADYFSKGSYITLNSEGHYFIMSHRHNIWKWSNGRDDNYSILVKSNSGNGSISNWNSDIFDIYDMTRSGNKVLALYKQTGFKTSELTVSETSINFENTSTIAGSSVSTMATHGTSLVVCGKNNTNLHSDFNGLAHIYTDVVVKGTKVSAVAHNGTFYAVYTDNADNSIKIREIVQPLSIAGFSFSEQTGPAVISIKDATISVEVASGTDLSNLVASFSTSSDVASIKIGGVDQVSGTTAGNFTEPVSYVVTATDETTRNWVVTVTLAPLQCNISTSSNPTEGGTTQGGGTYPEGTTVSLTATQNSDYRFVNWTEDGTPVSTDVEYSFIAASDRNLVANFIRQYTLSIETEGSGQVNVNEVLYAEPVIADQGSELTMKAIPGEGFRFVNWTDNGIPVSTDAEFSFTITSDRSLTANFIRQYSLTIATAGSGLVNVNDVLYTEVIKADQGTELTLKAIPGVGSRFVNWTEEGTPVSTEAEFSYSASSDRNLVANFIRQYSLTITTAGSGLVNVNDVLYTEVITADQGTELTLKAIAGQGFRFVNWTEEGTPVSTEAEFSYTASSDRNLTANFIRQYTLTITTAGSGLVKVNEVQYTEPIIVDHGTILNLEAVALTGWQFDGWSGSLISVETPKNITMESNQEITASFSISVGIKEEFLSGLQIFPNPFSNTITLRNAENASRIEITGIAGNKVLDIRLNGSQMIHTDNLDRGIYIITIEFENGMKVVRKMIKQ